MQYNKKHALWCEKYRPKSISEYVFHDKQHKASVMRFIMDKSIPHLLLSGVAGSGKTTLAQILISEMNVDPSDVKVINASDERGIDTFRDNIKSFATTSAMGTFKIVHLEEADMLTPAAQAALKSFMEEVSDHVRFILTCNHVNKIIAPIRSRCQEFYFKSADYNDIAEYLLNILVSEHVSFDLALLDKYIAFAYPDIRKIVNTLQLNSIDGVLMPPTLEGETGDYKFKLLDLIESNKWLDARKLVCSTVSSDEWEGVYRFLYENISKSPKFQDNDKWEEAILIIAEHLYKNSMVSDPEINAAACFIKLAQI
jgi:DNA polymerase III delta prime subunit